MLCGLISAALLTGAFLFEYIGGLAPCKMCIWQRWAHLAVIVVAKLSLTKLPRRLILFMIGSAATASALIAGYHAGVEWQLWTGPSGCTAALSSSISAADLVDDLLATAMVRCDEVAWSLFGLSMAGWNMVFSIGIIVIAGLGFRQTNRHSAQTDMNEGGGDDQPT